MDSQRKFYITLGILIVAIFCWAYFFYIPYLQAINTSRTKLLSFNTKINSASKASKNLEDIERRVQELSAELAQLEKKIIVKSQLENIAKILKREAQKYNVEVLNVSPMVSYYFTLNKNVLGKSYFSRLPVEMELQAKFLDFGKFLDNLYKLPFYMHPEGVTISGSKVSPYILSINLKVSLYIKTG